MKKLLVGIFLSFNIVTLGIPISDNLAIAFKTGNYEEIAKYFGNSVDLSIPDNEGVYSSAQAKLILKTFFQNNKPSDFIVVHNGNSKNNSHYSIGNLKTSTGNFRTYILYKEQDKKVTILELKIESDE